MKIKTRFAPSPTGDMHIGNLRAAIFNWLLARQNGGSFFLRIEDTDSVRSKKMYEDRILETLKWMGLDFDLFEGRIVKQSERISLYQDIAGKISSTYYCQCEDAAFCQCYDKDYKRGVLRFHVKKNQTLHFKDEVFSDLTTSSDQIENFALLRSDGTPTYNLAVVADDHFMDISHVIRGEDHKTNTFKQIMIYQDLGWQLPKFAHLPIIKGKDGKKLSKREKSSSVQELYDEGVNSKALFNILLKMGWGYGDEEIISKQRALEIFSLKGVKKHSSVFETGKLYSFSRKYMVNSKEEALEFLQSTYGHVNLDVFSYFYEEIAPKCQTFKDIIVVAPFIIENPYSKDAKKVLLGPSLENLIGKTMQEQRHIRLLVTGSENGLSLKSLWSFYREL